MDQIKQLANDLPMKDEIEQINSSEKKGTELDNQIGDMIMNKLV